MRTESVPLGYYACPDDAPPRAGLVLVPDVWGLHDHARDLARRLAAEGFAVLAVDLYRRTPGLRITDPGAFMRELSDPQVLEDLQAAIDHLRARPELRELRVGLLGFCMGGMYAVLGAALLSGLSAAVPFYGILSHDHGLLHAPEGLDPAKKPHAPLAIADRVRVPVLAFFGDRDVFVPLSDVEALESQLARSGQPHVVRVFPGAGHAFMNDTRPAMYVPEAATAAWSEMLAFFAQHLERGRAAQEP